MNDRLLNLRNDKNVNQKEVADYLQLTRQAYSRYERGEREPDFATLKKLAEYFNVTIDYLVGRNDEKEYKIATNRVENGILGDLNDKEKRLLEVFNSLSEPLQDYAIELVEGLNKNARFMKGSKQG